MDKENQSVRKYIAQRAELIGAIRLPENAFKQVAGTEVTTDILFLKKREQEIIPDERNTPWLSVEKDENGIPYNSYLQITRRWCWEPWHRKPVCMEAMIL